MESNPEKRTQRSRSALSIETITIDPQPPAEANDPDEEEFDNELTLTSDELFRAVNNKKGSGLYIDTLKGDFPKFHSFSNYGGDDKLLEKPQPQPKRAPKCSDIWYKLLQPFFNYIKSKTTWPMAKQVLKAAVAYWLAFLVDLIVPAMQCIGPGTFLAIVMVCYFQPSRTFGSLWESTGWGIIGACIAILWSYIGIIISNAVRGDEIFNIPATIINLIFLAIGTFVLSYDKIKWPPLRYGSINAIIIISFSLTLSFIRPNDTGKIFVAYLVPMLIGQACSITVNLILWPENATTNYIPCLHKTLQSFIDLLDQETHFFLRDTYNRHTISKLHRNVQDNLQSLETAKGEAQHEVSYSKIGPEDLIEINRLVKSMNMTLGGLALSGVIEEELMRDGQEGTVEIRIEDKGDCDSILGQGSYSIDYPLSPISTAGTLGNEEDLKRLLDILRPICTELSEACQMCLADCMTRVDHLRRDCNGPWYKQLWPFCLYPTPSHSQNLIDDPLGHLHSTMAKFNDARIMGLRRLFTDTDTISPSPQRMLLLLIFFENGLKIFAENLGFLVGLIKVLGTTRQSKRFWIPSIPLFKRIKSIGETMEDGWRFFEPQIRKCEEEINYGLCDPDVTSPSTTAQRFWYKLWLIRNWFNSKYARFALKNTLVVTTLCLPAFLPGSYKWFEDYHGQWALISAVLSFAPTTGSAVLQFFGRLLGSGVGAVMAIIAWETTQGNAYGLALILFLFSLILWFVYFNAKVWTVGGIIMLVNFPLVLANVYQSHNGVGITYETIFTIAAKRTSSVSIGITAAFIMNMFPWPHTGRAEIRTRLAHTIADIGVLYSMTVSSLLKRNHGSYSIIIARPFRKLVTHINRSIAIERLLLSRSKYEPPLRGNFPVEKYETILEIVEHLVNLVSGLENTLHELQGTEWKSDLADVLNPAKCHYITHVLTSFHILASALENKVPLPPYNFIASGDTSFGRVGLGSRISRRISKTALGLTKEDLETQSYACYCAYLIKTSHLINELMKLITVVKQLVGVNRYVSELIDFENNYVK